MREVLINSSNFYLLKPNTKQISLKLLIKLSFVVRTFFLLINTHSIAFNSRICVVIYGEELSYMPRTVSSNLSGFENSSCLRILFQIILQRCFSRVIYLHVSSVFNGGLKRQRWEEADYSRGDIFIEKL